MQLLLSTSGTSLATVLPQHTPAPAAPSGFAIQLRLVAEDSHKDFRLSPGTIVPSNVSWPAGKGIRVDTWLSHGPYAPDHGPNYNVGVDFDSLLAKLIAHGATFEEATAKALRAVREVRVHSEVKTNRDLLSGVVSHKEWRDGAVHTRWLEEHLDEVIPLGETKLQRPHEQIASPSGAATSNSPGTTSRDVTGASGTLLLQPGSSFQLSLSPAGSGTSRSPSTTQKHNIVISTIGHNAFPDQLSGTLTTSLTPAPLAFSLTQLSNISTSSQVEFANPQDPTHLSCPLAGKIVELHSALSGAGSDRFIRAGEPLIVVSVMKMESVVNAPVSGRVSRLGKGIEVGAVIPEGSLVCVLDGQSAGSIAKL